MLNGELANQIFAMKIRRLPNNFLNEMLLLNIMDYLLNLNVCRLKSQIFVGVF